MTLDDAETDREAILGELAKLRYLDSRFNAAITIISVSSLGCIPALHGGQISGLRSRAAAYIRDTAQGQLNSVTFNVPAVLSLLRALI